MNPSDFRLTAIIKSVMAETWHRVQSDERREHERLCRVAGVEPNGMGAARIPGYALRADLDTTSGSGLTGTIRNGEYIGSLTGDSAALRLGVRSLPVPAETSVFAVPRASAGATAYWLSSEVAQVTDSAPMVGQAVAAPKLLAAYCEISRLLLLQAPNCEQVVRAELRRTAALALDAAIFAGEGVSGAPQGIIGTSNVGAFTGTSLDQAALRNAQADVAKAKAITDPSKLAYVTTGTVAELLSKRARVASSDRMLWEGASHDGIVEGCRAISSEALPAGAMIFGDWSSCWVAEFAGGLVLEVDPFTQFQAGIVGLRLLMPCDVLMTRPAAFSVASSIT